jgi:Family of unknown function (DUF6350)
MSPMTNLLDPPIRTGRTADTGEAPPRPLALTSAVAGLGASLGVLMGCWVVGLVGWFASDDGTHGDTKDALRVGTDGWLLGHGANLHLAASGATTISAMPLGLTLLCLYVAHRLGAWAVRTSAVDDLRGLLLGGVVMSGVYGVVALVASVLAATPVAEPSLLGAFGGGFLVAAVGGGSGMLRAGRSSVDWASRAPETVRAVAFGALATVLLLAAAGSVLLTVALALDFGTAANVLSRLHVDPAGGLLYTLVVAAVAPNAVLLTGSYLLGPGFAVGTGTVVSPGAVVLGPVPAFPLLAALPSPGTPPSWLAGLVAAPVLAAVASVVLVQRRYPTFSWESGALRGLLTGLAAGVLTTALVGLAGGAVGPGRMSDVGAGLLGVLVSATVAMGVGGLVSGVAATWWTRRR